MRTVLEIDDQLLLAAKKVAAESGRTLTAVIEDALRVALSQDNRAADTEKFALPAFHLGVTLPGVDLDNSAALLDIMEESDGPV